MSTPSTNSADGREPVQSGPVRHSRLKCGRHEGCVGGWRLDVARQQCPCRMLSAACCTLHVALLHVVCCMLHVACRKFRMLRVALLHIACQHSARCTASCTLQRCMLHVAAMQVRTERTASMSVASGRQRRRGSSSGARRTLERRTQPATRFAWKAPRDARRAARSNVHRTRRVRPLGDSTGIPNRHAPSAGAVTSGPWAQPGPV